MEFSNSFTVDAPLDRVWRVLTDPRQVTPCVPGAQITEMIDDTHFNGTVKVKLGAVQMSYRGAMEMEPDEASHTIVLQGKGTATGGGGGASGKVTVRLEGSEGGTAVEILSQVDVTGRVAQFGRGIMQDVSNRLIKEFASCLQQTLATAGEEQEAGDIQPDAGMSPAVQSDPTAGSHTAQSEAPTAETSPQYIAHPAAEPPRPLSEERNTSQSELSLTTLALDITRSRLAAGLRYLANRIEPK